MANLHARNKKSKQRLNFRYIRDIQDLPEKELNNYGYYRGFPCVHNHEIRDKADHWCYFCAKKIISNICCFDLNYINSEYKRKYFLLWKNILVQDFDQCWYLKADFSPRICLPSYRSLYSRQRAENVSIHKAIYQCAWGDIGRHSVTRLCKNKDCYNPLHLTSSWNQLYPPESIKPFEIEFQPEKLMLYKQHESSSKILESQYKQTIKSPLDLKDTNE